MAKLEIKSGEKNWQVSIDKPRLTIGRHATNDVVIEDTKASRIHASLEKGETAYVLRDLDSRNGVWVGRDRVASAEIFDECCFRIGDTQFCLHDARVKGTTRLSHPAAGAPRRAGKPGAEPPSDSGVLELPSREHLETVEVDSTLEVLEAGPLSRQLAPLIKAAQSRTASRGAPTALRDIKLLDRQLRAFQEASLEGARANEALMAMKHLLLATLRVQATDIHLEPREEGLRIRVRIDGLLVQVGDLNRVLGIALLNVIKVLSDIDIAKRNVVQEGNFAADLPDRRVDFRVSFTPTVHGQKLALRLLDKAMVPSALDYLGMEAALAAEVRRISNQDGGMVIVAGPTGAGKSTTLYTALRGIDAKARNVVTIEDPVEYQIEHATQISIDPRHDINFASVLASVLRQDPDVIMVGEIRDRETADLAMRAATTGHLVFTTIHARDCIGTIFRLLDLGVEPYLIANSISLVLSQRLVRVLCPHCKKPYRPDARRVRDMRLDEHYAGTLYTHVGCGRCMGIGFAGRTAVFELLSFNPALRDVILTKPTITELRKAAGDWMFRTLVDSGYRRVLDGQTTVEEVERVATSD